MAVGNLFIVIPSSAKDNLIPEEFKDKWNITESVEVTTLVDGEEVTEIENHPIHPTWIQVGKHLEPKFGAVREFEFNEKSYIMIEAELSFLKQEMQTMLTLKENYTQSLIDNNLPVDPLEYAVLNVNEARELLAGKDIFN